MTLYELLQATALFGGVAIGLVPAAGHSYVALGTAALVGLLFGGATVLLCWRLTRRVASAWHDGRVGSEVMLGGMYLGAFVGVSCVGACATRAARWMLGAV